LLRGTSVKGITRDGATITAVLTDRGAIRTDTVVCAAGPWSQAIGAMAGVELPVVPIRRQILTTEPMAGLDPRTPFTIDFTTSFYFHGEGRGLLLGMSDPEETPGFKFQRSDDWLPRLGEVIEHRAPKLAEIGIAGGWAGLYEMTPDHNAIIGEAAEVSRFLYATGFSGHGFLMGPAVGEVMRDLYHGSTPAVDVSGLHASRFRESTIRPELNIV
jgi:sarcosine oxidase subunit beta